MVEGVTAGAAGVVSDPASAGVIVERLGDVVNSVEDWSPRGDASSELLSGDFCVLVTAK